MGGVEAQEQLLRIDARFQNVDDTKVREELFRDFINELIGEKGQRTRKIKTSCAKRDCLFFDEFLDSLANSEKINHRSIWYDCKEFVLAKAKKKNS